MHTGKPKITKNERNHLIQIYLHMGVEEARIMSVEYKVHFRYAEKQAFELGRGVRTRRINRAARHQKITNITRNCHDPRWEWAKERGPVFV